jgi:hypothetical protein
MPQPKTYQTTREWVELMRRDEARKKRDLVIHAIDCPYCGALPGAACHAPSDATRHAVPMHASRLSAFVRMRETGLRQGYLFPLK